MNDLTESDEYMNSLLQRAQELLTENSFTYLIQSSSSSNSSKSVSSSLAMSPTDSPVLDNSIVIPPIHGEEKQIREEDCPSPEKNQSRLDEISKLSFGYTNSESVVQHNNNNSEQSNEDDIWHMAPTTTMVSTAIQVDIWHKPESDVTLPSEDKSTSTSTNHQPLSVKNGIVQQHGSVPGSSGEEKGTATHRSSSPTATTAQERADSTDDDDSIELSAEQMELYKQRVAEDKVCQLLRRKIQFLEARLSELQKQ